MKKNYCSGCGYNFATESMHAQHRAGEYSYQTEAHPKQPVGTSPRRCKTADEMYAMGWQLETIAVDSTSEGKVSRVPLPTWVLPGQIEKKQQASQRLHAAKQHKHTV